MCENNLAASLSTVSELAKKTDFTPSSRLKCRFKSYLSKQTQAAAAVGKLLIQVDKLWRQLSERDLVGCSTRCMGATETGKRGLKQALNEVCGVCVCVCVWTHRYKQHAWNVSNKAWGVSFPVTRTSFFHACPMKRNRKGVVINLFVQDLQIQSTHAWLVHWIAITFVV